MTDPTDGDAVRRPRPLVRPLVEFAIVGGASLFVIFYLIPNETMATANWGLSPRMVPTVSAALILGLAAINLVAGLLRPATVAAAQSLHGLPTVVALILASVVGVAVVDRAGLIVGGTVLSLLVSLSIGERHPLRLLGVGATSLALLYLVDWSGL
ncbi:tripartite tricarboxylate transporter TctB family protein [Acuticoccus mangrovi]|uniref:Tripartite tricarboxylate transporter TctB family protein n=1 Tax=Acuticoccus mangrovi TaxID=2796142 RepID=A0A934MLH2_9HYPH|nr:tripartite tricarboxylate transporter TctB family protein [Acuticoccus mangrovi]MBJ3776369.1 hypothetical protein [Acuticoccus mangrovi]